MGNITINWAKLLARTPPNVKDYGIFWTEEERIALMEKKIPADYVRAGCLTQEAYEAMKKKNEAYQEENGELPLMFWEVDAIHIEADRLGVQYTAFTPRTVLTVAIEQAREREQDNEAKLDDLSKKELQALCDEKEIEYETSDKKDDLIEKLKEVIV